VRRPRLCNNRRLLPRHSKSLSKDARCGRSSGRGMARWQELAPFNQTAVAAEATMPPQSTRGRDGAAASEHEPRRKTKPARWRAPPVPAQLI